MLQLKCYPNTENPALHQAKLRAYGLTKDRRDA